MPSKARLCRILHNQEMDSCERLCCTTRKHWRKREHCMYDWRSGLFLCGTCWNTSNPGNTLDIGLKTMSHPPQSASEITRNALYQAIRKTFRLVLHQSAFPSRDVMTIHCFASEPMHDRISGEPIGPTVTQKDVEKMMEYGLQHLTLDDTFMQGFLPGKSPLRKSAAWVEAMEPLRKAREALSAPTNILATATC